MGIIEVENLTKIYKLEIGEKLALDNLNLSIEQGEFIALLGPNGAGKSTFINILADTVTPTTGVVRINNYDLKKDRQACRRSIGIVPQDLNFDPFFSAFNLLKLQNGIYGKKYDKEHIFQLLETLALKDKALSPPRELSGGMRRRLLIAKALIHRPSILVLDEPTAGVDVELRNHMWSFIKDLNKQGVTILLTTHYLEEAQQLCNKIAIINHGKLIKYCNTEELIDTIGIHSITVIVGEDISKLKNLDTASPYTLDPPNKIKFDINDRHEIGNAINAILKHKLTIVDFISKEPRLEDIFLKLTKNKSA